MERTELDIFVKDLREYAGRDNEVPVYGKQTFRDEKTRMRMFFEHDVSDDEVEEKIKINLNWKLNQPPKNYLNDNYLYIERCYLLMDTVDVVKTKVPTSRLY